MGLKPIYCVRCKKKHVSERGWSHRKWDTPKGVVEGWGCTDYNVKYPEFVPDHVKQQRYDHKKSIVQPHREGVVSREWIDTYGMKKASERFTKEEISKARYVWRGDVEGW